MYSCAKKETIYANGIKKLTGKTPQKIKLSTLSVNAEATVNFDIIDLGSIPNVPDKNFFYLINSSNELYLEANDDIEPNGGQIYLKKNSKTYSGTKYTFKSKKDCIIIEATMQNVSDAQDKINIKATMETTQLGAGNSTYSISGDEATISGSLGSLTYNQILEINSKHPEVSKIVLALVDGSVNDDVNVLTGRLIRQAGYTTVVKSNSKIYSGGVDLYCSGLKRTWENGAEVGVHSWCCYQGKTAEELPKDSKGHATQLAYFTEMLGKEDGEAFYFFTIYAAPFDGIHLMSEAELKQYKLIK